MLSAVAALETVPDILRPINPIRAFFVMSGFLVVFSYERSRDWKDYAERKLMRIFPVYIFVIILTALLLTENYGSAFWKYLAANLTTLNFVAPTLPGVFGGNPEPWVNGALWTMKVDLMLYACVPGIVWAVRRWGPERALGALYSASVTYESIFLAQAERWPLAYQLSVQMPAQLSCFVTGAYILYRFDWFDRNVHRLFPVALILYPVAWLLKLYPIMPAALGVLLISVCLYFPWRLPRLRQDYSYALFLVHFPIIQVLVSQGAAAWPPALYVTAAVAAPAAAAFLVWHLFEKHTVGLRFNRIVSAWRPIKTARPDHAA